MSYMALYRKFRPQTFDQVKGQDHVVRTLKNQIRNNRIGHAYLFAGTRGTGKTTVAKLFARAVNCLAPVDGEPCGTCEHCQAILRDSFMDVVEVDAASNTGVDDIRRIIEEVRYTPTSGKYKVYIIDEAHMLSGPAFNAFLKTLEEPPSYAVFILATTEPHKLPITILSRCQRYDFHRIETDTIAANLSDLLKAEGVDAEERAVRYIARMGDGSMRDAISLLDKCIAFSLGETLTYDMVLQTLGTVDSVVFSRTFNAVWKGDAAAALSEIEKSAAGGGDVSRFVNDFIWYLRNLLLIKAAPGTDPEVLGVSSENMEILRNDAAFASEEILMRYIRILSELANNIRNVASRQIPVEVAFIKLARPEMESDTASLADRIRHLENAISAITSGAAVIQSAPPVYSQPVQPQPVAPAPVPAPEEVPLQQTEPKPAEVSVAQITEEVLNAASGEGASAAGKACSCWNSIIANVDSPPLRFALKKAQVQEVSQDRIRIFGVDSINYTKIKENIPEIEKVISAYIGEKVTAEVKEGKSGAEVRPAAPAKAPAPAVQSENSPKESGDIDDLLKFINFDVRMEDS